MVRFTDLPNEIVLMIAQFLIAPPDSKLPRRNRSLADLLSLARLSRRFYYTLIPTMYKVDAVDSCLPIALMWGAATGRIKTMERAVVAGTKINQYINTKYLECRRFFPCRPKINTLQRLNTLGEFDPEPVKGSYSPNFTATALHLAAANNQTEAVAWLVDREASLTVGLRARFPRREEGRLRRRHLPPFPSNHYHWHPIALAVWYGHLETAKVLVEKGASMFICHAERKYPARSVNALHIAVGRGHCPLFQYLIQYAESCSKNGEIALGIAGIREEYGATLMGIAARTSNNQKIITELAWAGIRARIATSPLTESVESHSTPRNDDFFITSHNRLENILYILRTGAHSPLSRDHCRQILTCYFSCEDGRPSYGLEPAPGDMEGQIKSVRGRIDIIEYIFTAGYIDINDEIYDGKTALMMAAECRPICSARLVLLLLNLPGCKPEIRRRSVRTNLSHNALYMAVREWLRYIETTPSGAHNEEVLDEMVGIVMAFLHCPNGRITRSHKSSILLEKGGGRTIFDLICDLVSAVVSKLKKDGPAKTQRGQDAQQLKLQGTREALRLYPKIVDLGLERCLFGSRDAEPLRNQLGEMEGTLAKMQDTLEKHQDALEEKARLARQGCVAL